MLTMKIKLISGEFCSRCHMIKPLLEKYAEKNGYTFIEKDSSLATPEEIEWASMLPVIWFWDERLELDDVIARISE